MASRTLAQMFMSHLDCLHVRPDLAALVAGSTAGFETAISVGTFSAGVWEELEKGNEQMAVSAHRGFERFVSAHPIECRDYLDGVESALRSGARLKAISRARSPARHGCTTSSC
jgi:hypothetical protein